MFPGKESFDAVSALSLVEEIPSDYDDDTDIDEDFDQEDHEGNVLISRPDPITRAENDADQEVAGCSTPASGNNESSASICTVQEDDDDDGSDVTTTVPRANTSIPSSRRRWKKKHEAVPDSQFDPYPNSIINSINSPLDAFLKFFDEEMITRIHFETNLYCTQKGKVGNVTKEEIMVFFGINIIMAYHRLPAIRHYWMTSDDMGVKSIQNAMTRDRFTFILGKLHLNDNSKIGPSNKEKLWKLKPVVERMNVLCQNNKIPAEHLSIDESMIRFKGRSSPKTI